MISEFNQGNWERLLSEIEDGKVVPILGSELLSMQLNGTTVNFQGYLAKELAERLGVSSAVGKDAGLNDVANTFLSNHGDYTDIYYEIHQIITSRQWPVPESLKQLAAIRHFNLFLSTTFDPFMKYAIDIVRYGGAETTEVIAYSNMGQIEDLSSEFLRSAYPLVFHIFGKVSSTPDYAVTNDDLLKFNHRLQSRDLRPPNLFDLLRSSHLLLLGCNFPNWLARFFSCAAKGDLLFSPMGMRGVVADHTTVSDSHLHGFYSRRKTQLYKEGDAVAFVAELFKKWSARFGNTPSENSDFLKTTVDTEDDFPVDGIFLSYASEDRETAISLKSALDRAKLDVWFDRKRLSAGDRYKSKILRHIEKSSFFIPVLSQSVETLDKRFFRLEWDKALEVARQLPGNFPFILPVVIDQLSPDSPFIPDGFKERHWQNFTGGEASEGFDQFIVHIRQWIRSLRSNRQGQV
jgi:hypothetical protein